MPRAVRFAPPTTNRSRGPAARSIVASTKRRERRRTRATSADPRWHASCSIDFERTNTRSKEAYVNWDQIEGNWKQVKGQIKQKWAKLTDDDLKLIDGKRIELVGRLQERHGITKEQAEKQIDEFVSGLRI